MHEMTAIRLILLVVVFASISAISEGLKQRLVILSLDGVGWQYISGRFANTPNLDAVKQDGVHADYVQNVFPTVTWPNHHSMLTGLYTESHGIVGNSFWDPVYKQEFHIGYDCTNYDNKFWNASEPVWLTLQKKGGHSGVFIWPGYNSYQDKPTYYEKPVCNINCSSVYGWVPPSAINYNCISNLSVPLRSRIDKVMSWLKSKVNPPTFVAMQFGDADLEGHNFGPNSLQYKAGVEQFDRDIVGYFTSSLRSAGIANETNVIFVSDHSFVETTSNRQVYLSDYLESGAYHGLLETTIAQIIPKVGKEEEIYKNLTDKKHPNITVYKKNQIPEVFHWRNNRRIPSIFILADLGWVITKERPSVATTWTKGTHGYSNQVREMWPIFIATGPAFRKGYKIKPFQNVDLYPLICHVIGVEPHSHNGSFERIKLMLKEFSTKSRQQKLSGNNFIYTVVLILVLVVTLDFAE